MRTQKTYLERNELIEMMEKEKNIQNDYSFFEELLNEGENRLGMLDVFHRYDNVKMISSELHIQKINKDAIEKVIRFGKKEVRNNNELYNHYRIFYPTIPIWVVIHQLTLSELQSLFNLLKLKDRVDFVEEVYHERKSQVIVSAFSNKINYIRLIRNIINHYEPIIPFIKRHNDEGQKEVLFEIIHILKDNYYRSEYHEKSKVIKPKVDITMNDYNQESIVFLNKIIKKI